MQTLNKNKSLGWWIQDDKPPQTGGHILKNSIHKVTRPVFLVNQNNQIAIGEDGTAVIGKQCSPSSESYPLCGYAPPLHPENLGDPVFKQTHRLRYAIVAGEMARGITSVKMVKETGSAGMIGFFGAAGLSLEEINSAIDQLQSHHPEIPFGFNLINSPNEPEIEDAVVKLYLKRGVRLISASAYMDLTLPLVYYRVKGIYRDHQGAVVCPNKIVAKISRVEVARKFLSPPPEKLLSQLINQHMISTEEATLASYIPMAEDITAEADSGGHTDNRPAISLLPTILALRDELVQKFRYTKAPCVGLAGGISTPESTAAAFAMGAAYVLTGSVNQSCVEAGTSEIVRRMLAEAGQADVTMAPCADMFEMGVKVQVLKRGTMYPQRAARLYDLYCKYDRLESIPDNEKLILERDFFRNTIENEWEETKRFFTKRDPKQIQRVDKDPRHKMALVFRSYLGRSSKWAIQGDVSRKLDYQIWCGPSLGAFNEWVKGSFLEKPENRKTVTVAMNLLLGASVVTRTNWLRSQGNILPSDTGRFSPMELSDILTILDE